MSFSNPSQSSSQNTDEETPILSEINITPLTDIFLVLLIIFMVTTSIANQMGVEVNLPKASPATAQAQPEGVIITLMSGGRMQVNGHSIQAGDYETMKTTLTQAFTQTSSRLVILEGDRESYLGSAIEVMDEARKAGAAQFAIATDPEARKSK
jgi:biopolymer transport protein ExbD